MRAPFVGRLDEDGQDGMLLVEEIVSIFENYGFETEVLVASVRDARQVTEAALAGAHVATLPKAIFDKLFYPRTTAGLENFYPTGNALTSPHNGFAFKPAPLPWRGGLFNRH